MSAHVSEAYVLQTYPFKEGDLIVSFLTRDLGKLRGVARRARRPKSGFGSGLERLSHIRMSYFQRENRDLVNVDGCDLLHSQFSLLGDFTAACALDYLAEVSEQLLPPSEPSEKFFRLLHTVLEHMHSAVPGAVWRSVTYFSIWTVRLSGLLPELHACLSCGSWLEDPELPQRAYFNRFRSGLYCGECRRAHNVHNTWELTSESRKIADNMLRTPLAEVQPEHWTQGTATDLRRFLAQQIENQIERRLVTFPILEAAA